MNPLIRQLVNQKIQTLTVKELIRQAREHKVNLTVKQAQLVLKVLHDEQFDIGNEQLVGRINVKLKKIDLSLYEKTRQLLKPYEKYLNYSLD